MNYRSPSSSKTSFKSIYDEKSVHEIWIFLHRVQCISRNDDVRRRFVVIRFSTGEPNLDRSIFISTRNVTNFCHTEIRFMIYFHDMSLLNIMKNVARHVFPNSKTMFLTVNSSNVNLVHQRTFFRVFTISIFFLVDRASTKSTPFRWSVSCWKTRAHHPLSSCLYGTPEKSW